MVFAQSFGFGFCLTLSLFTDIEKIMLSTLVCKMCREGEGGGGGAFPVYDFGSRSDSEAGNAFQLVERHRFQNENV